MVLWIDLSPCLAASRVEHWITGVRVMAARRSMEAVKGLGCRQ